MKTYKDMTWDELEECADMIREELASMEALLLTWEVRGTSPYPDFHDRFVELTQELGDIRSLQNKD